MSASTLRPKMKPFNNLKKEMLTMSCEELKELRARLGLCVYLSERPRSSERGKSVWEEKHEKQALYYCCPWKRELFFMEGERGELEDKDQKWLLKWSVFFCGPRSWLNGLFCCCCPFVHLLKMKKQPKEAEKNMTNEKEKKTEFLGFIKISLVVPVIKKLFWMK